MPALAVTVPFGFTFDPVRLGAAYAALGATKAQFYRNEQKPPTVKEALAACKSAGLIIDSIHGVFGEHIDPTSPDQAERDRCLRVYENEGKLAKDLGGPMVVVHPACFFPGMKLVSEDEVRATSAPRWPRLDVWLKQLAEIGERLGVTYLIENQPRNCPLGHDAVKLAQHVAAAGSARIRMCYDTGHAHMTGDVPTTLRECAPVIEYLHIHDNDSKVDDHRMPFDGNLDWSAVAQVLSETKLNAPRMLEVFYEEERVERLGREGLGAKLRSALSL